MEAIFCYHEAIVISHVALIKSLVIPRWPTEHEEAAAASSISALSLLPPPHPIRRSADRACDGQHRREVARKALPVIAAVRAGEDLAVARAD